MIEAQVRLRPGTTVLSCLLNTASDLTIANSDLKDFSQDIEPDQVLFSGAGSHGTSREYGTLSIKVGSMVECYETVHKALPWY